MSPIITVGCAVYDDFEGLWSTIQSVFLHNDWGSPNDVQIVIVDTSPIGSDHRRLIQDFVGKGGNPVKGSRTENIKYVDMAGFAGTTKPRDVIFDHATAPIVCVMDCHVLLPSNALLRLVQWFDANPGCRDLIHGPMLYDNLHAMSTQFSDQFRRGMWGTWGTSWLSPGGQVFTCEHEEVTDENVKQRSSDGKVHFHDSITLAEFDRTETAFNFPSGETFPANIPWGGHERKLIELGCVQMGRDSEAEPFEIPGCGMGLFASRKDSWLKFANNCTGFGGEEMNIHARYRNAGRKTLCLPFLKWNHRFGRAGGAPYPIPLMAKIRNYVLWAVENGNPESGKFDADGKPITTLDRIYTHFVKGGQVPEQRWRELLADPVAFHVELKPNKQPNAQPALDTLFAQVANSARDLKEHAETIRNVAGKFRTIRAFVKRCDWETILAASFPTKLETWNAEENALIDQTHAAVKAQMVKDNRKVEQYDTHRNAEEIDPRKIEPGECELLVIDRDNSAEYLSAVLNRHAATTTKAILIRGTQAFGEKAEGEEKPGLFLAMREFIEANPDWFIYAHYPKQYGVTILSRDPMLKPDKPIRIWPKGYGPGTELAKMLADVGIDPPANCGCKATMREMDELGVEGCRKNRQAYIDRIKQNAEKWGWGKLSTMHTLAGVGVKSMLNGLAWKVNWLDPFPGLVDEAIKRAEAHEADACTKDCKPEGCTKPNCKKKATA
jgi:hypothetical protein